MTNNTPLPTIDELAAIAFNSYYFDDLATYTQIAEMIADASPAPLHAMLADAIDDDIRDLLHNANDPDLFPFLDHSDDDTLSDYLLTDYAAMTDLAATIAQIALARAA